MIAVDCVQGTDEWLQARCGYVTASRICDVMAKIKSGEAAARRDYKAQLVCELLTGKPAEDGYQNAAMQWGTANEPFARAAYELAHECFVDQVGFVIHPTVGRSGASPDGLVGKRGGLELKCPKTATHIQWILAGGVPTEHQYQLLWNMACADRDWWDFASYDPRLPEHLQLFVVRMHRDDKRIAEIETEVIRFNAEVDEIIARLPKA